MKLLTIGYPSHSKFNEFSRKAKGRPVSLAEEEEDEEDGNLSVAHELESIEWIYGQPSKSTRLSLFLYRLTDVISILLFLASMLSCSSRE